MAADPDEPDTSTSGDARAPHDARLTPSWRTIFTACEALDAEDPAWDSVDGFVEAVSTLASIRRAERERIESARREAVAIARARLASVVDATRSSPGCERVAAEMDRVLA